MSGDAIRVLVADDQPLARRGLRGILESEPGFEVVGEAVDGADAVGQAERRRPDVVLMDIRMPRMDGLEATRRLSALDPPVDVIVVTTFDLDEYVFGALRAGASGFLLKDADPELIIDAVRAVHGGGGLIAPDVTRRLIHRFAAVEPSRSDDPALAELTPREVDVLLGIARGLSNAGIAASLVLEESTVKSHVGRILSKLDLQSRVQAVIYAYETGLVLPGDGVPEGARGELAAGDASSPGDGR
ncbi:response regulator transcription factor [Patulibacter defluvii]|uniref:response regulator transcription factor n=1 Tax=Patulibacter defluvii TaxID=3095358 RepID=UPI002A75409E|nr:response regulator transcription factor [Patulibacter sp. DM4]